MKTVKKPYPNLHLFTTNSGKPLVPEEGLLTGQVPRGRGPPEQVGEGVLPAVLQLVGEGAEAEGGVARVVLDGLHVAHAVEAVAEELGEGEEGRGQAEVWTLRRSRSKEHFSLRPVASVDALLVLP